MTDSVSTPPKAAGVSRSRKAFSLVLLLSMIAVLGIELRAGLGQSRSMKQLAAISSDGTFNNVPLSDAQQMLSLSPKATVIRDNKFEKVVHYQWHSLLRPLIGRPDSELYLVSSATEPAYAMAFYTDREDAASGLYGDSVFIEYSLDEPMPHDDNPLNLPDAPLKVPATENESSDSSTHEVK